jgi:hypothetical protein
MGNLLPSNKKALIPFWSVDGKSNYKATFGWTAFVASATIGSVFGFSQKEHKIYDQYEGIHVAAAALSVLMIAAAMVTLPSVCRKMKKGAGDNAEGTVVNSTYGGEAVEPPKGSFSAVSISMGFNLLMLVPMGLLVDSNYSAHPYCANGTFAGDHGQFNNMTDQTCWDTKFQSMQDEYVESHFVHGVGYLMLGLLLAGATTGLHAVGSKLGACCDLWSGSKTPGYTEIGDGNTQHNAMYGSAN